MKKIGKVLQQILSGGFLTHQGVRRYYPFLLFIVALILIWIGNTYSYRHTSHKIAALKTELELDKNELQNLERARTCMYKPSYLIEKLAEDDDTTSIIKMPQNATYKIVVN